MKSSRIWIFVLPALWVPASAYPQADASLQKLSEGNKRFVEGKSIHPQQDAARRTEVAKGQKPFASILACADSRVGPEVLFDQGLGDLFVVRLAGNTIDDLALGSLEYGAAVLGSPLILVLGHESCGAVEATMQGKPVPGHIQKLVDHLKPDIQSKTPCALKTPLDCATHANVQNVAAKLRSSEPVLAPMVKEGKVKVVGGYYNLGTGKVEILP